MLVYSWDDFTTDARKIAAWARKQPPFDGVYGIPRGGLPLAVYLSHTLFLPLILKAREATTDTLYVDDNAVTGFSIQIVENFGMRRQKTAVLISHPNCRSCAAFSARITPKFPVFPWEADSTVEAAHRKAIGE